MATKITCVYDEGAMMNTNLIGAKGTSFLVEKGGKKVLFNVGLRDRYLIHNMEFLDIDAETIDAVVISQAHPNDSRALNGFLKMRENPVDVYAPEGLYGKKTLISGMGLADDNVSKAVFHSIGTWTEIVPGVHLSPFIYDSKGYGETFLVVQCKKLILISGRCSCGPEAFLSAAKEHFGRKVDVFMGGIFLEKAKKPVAEAYANVLRDSGCTELYLNHCTGKDGMVKLRTHLTLEGVNDFYVGNVFESLDIPLN